MKLTKTIALTAATLMAVTTAFASELPGSADKIAFHSTVEGWNVFSDAEREACYVERADDAGHVVQVGLTKNKKHGYLGVFTLADMKIKKKEKFDVDINGFTFDGKARGMKSKKLQGDYRGAYYVIKDDNMANALMQEGTMTVFPKKKEAFQVDLTGLNAAVEEAKICTAAMSS